MTHMYFSARTEGRLSYGHLGRTSLFLFMTCQWHRPLPVIYNKLAYLFVCCVSLYATIVLA